MVKLLCRCQVTVATVLSSKYHIVANHFLHKDQKKDPTTKTRKKIQHLVSRLVKILKDASITNYPTLNAKINVENNRRESFAQQIRSHYNRVSKNSLTDMCFTCGYSSVPFKPDDSMLKLVWSLLIKIEYMNINSMLPGNGVSAIQQIML